MAQNLAKNRAQNLKEEVDWVVLGDHPGALLSGVIAARSGLSVLFVPIEQAPRVTWSASGVLHDLESSFVSGLGSWTSPDAEEEVSGLLSNTLIQLNSELDRPMLSSPIQKDHDTWIVTPQVRLQLSGDQSLWKKELKREGLWREIAIQGKGVVYPERDSLHRWNEWPLEFVAKGAESSQNSVRRSASSVVGRMPGVNSKVNQLHSDTLTLGSDLDRAVEYLNQSGVMTRTSSFPGNYSLARAGANVRGGRSELRRYLLRLGESWGAQIASVAHPLQRVFVSNQTFAGVQLSGQGKMISVKGGICGMELSRLERHLSFEEGKSTGLKKRGRPQSWVFTVAARVPDRIQRAGFDRLVWSEAGAPPVEFEFLRKEEFGWVDPGYLHIQMRTLLPVEAKFFLPKKQRLLASRMLRQLQELVGPIEEHELTMTPDFRFEDPDFERLFSARGADELPDAISRYSVGHGIQSGVKRLLIANSSTYAEMGVAGWISAAFESAAWIAFQRGLSGIWVPTGVQTADERKMS